jgi:hypothetical protein
MEPKLKAHGTKRLKPKFDILLSDFAFNFILLRFTTAADVLSLLQLQRATGQGLTLVHFSAQRKHILWDTSGAWFSPSLLDRGTRGGVKYSKTA